MPVNASQRSPWRKSNWLIRLVLAQIRAEMHHIEAACYYQSNRLEDAEQAIRRAIAIDPVQRYLPQYLWRDLAQTVSVLEEAVRSYEVVMQLQPNFADVYYNCGNALNELERKKEAVARFKRCLGDQSRPCFRPSQCRQLPARSQISRRGS